jgi:uncharacterized membrane protein
MCGRIEGNTKMEFIYTTTNGLHMIANFVGTLIGAVGVAVIFIGCIRGLYFFIAKFVSKDILIIDVRIDLGHYLALGLEFLVGKDIIESLVDPTWNDLGKLAVLVLLRTFVTLFLGYEEKELREELEEDKEIRKLKKSYLRRKKKEKKQQGK